MKMYTAQEMRVRADYLEGALADKKTAAMLRQAADMMWLQYDYDVVQCRRCQAARSGEGYGDTPPPIGDDDICDKCDIAKRIRCNEEVSE